MINVVIDTNVLISTLRSNRGAGCEYIITCNLNDFKGIEQFGVVAITPKQFFNKIGEL